MNQSVAVETCRMCGRSFLIDLDDDPVTFDRDTGDPVPACPACVGDVLAVFAEFEVRPRRFGKSRPPGES